MSRALDELFSELPKTLSVLQAAEILGITKQGAYQWLRNGTIPAYRVGSSWIILRDELKEMIAAGSNAMGVHEDDDEGDATRPDA